MWKLRMSDYLAGAAFLAGAWVIWNEVAWLNRSQVAKPILAVAIGICLLAVAVFARPGREP